MAKINISVESVFIQCLSADGLLTETSEWPMLAVSCHLKSQTLALPILDTSSHWVQRRGMTKKLVPETCAIHSLYGIKMSWSLTVGQFQSLSCNTSCRVPCCPDDWEDVDVLRGCVPVPEARQSLGQRYRSSATIGLPLAAGSGFNSLFGGR